MRARNRARGVRLTAAVAAVVILQACAWQRIPAAPTFAPVAPLPITVGVSLSSSPSSDYYGPKVVKLLSQMSIVDELVYPYREDDELDAELGIAIDGSWKGSGFGAGFVIGLTLGLLSPVVGPSISGVHDLSATLTNDNGQLATHSSRVVSKVTWGIAGDANEVSAKADDLQARKIAVNIAEWLQANRSAIVRKLQ